MVAYLPRSTTLYTGTIRLKEQRQYQAQWFNPREGTFTSIGDVALLEGLWFIANQPDSEDWVLLISSTSDTFVASL